MELKRPTKEAIEAAISAYEMPTTIASREMAIFTELLETSGDFNGNAFGFCAALLATVEGVEAEVDPNDVHAYVRSHDSAVIDRYLHAVMKFFWIGWHARGAQEDAERLQGVL